MSEILLKTAGEVSIAVSPDATDYILGSVDGQTRRLSRAQAAGFISDKNLYEGVAEVEAASQSFTAGTRFHLTTGSAILEAVASGGTITNAGSQEFTVITGPRFAERTADALTEIARYPDGTMGYAAGQGYVADSTATGSDSAGNDLGVDGVRVWFGASTPAVLGSWEGTAAEATAALKAAISAVEADGGGTVHIRERGTVALTEGITLSENVDLVAEGTLDFSTAAVTDLVEFSTGSYSPIYKNGGAYSALPAFSAITAGDRSVTFTSAHGLSVGDVFHVMDYDNGSFLATRNHYRKGELHRVIAVEGLTVWTDHPSDFDYTHSGTVYAMKRPNATGLIEVRHLALDGLDPTGATGLTYGPVLRNLVDAKLHGVATGANYCGGMIERCLDPRVNFSGSTAVRSTFPGDAVVGNDYGFIYANCRGLKGTVNGTGNWHGVASGGGDYDGNLQSTDCVLTGGTATSRYNVQGADMHGDSLRCAYEGYVIEGGAALGGQDVFYRDCKIYNRGTDGRDATVIFSEMRGGRCGLIDCDVYSEKNASTTATAMVAVGVTGGPVADLVEDLEVVIQGGSLVGASEERPIRINQNAAPAGRCIWPNVRTSVDLPAADIFIVMDADGRGSPVTAPSFVCMPSGKWGVSGAQYALFGAGYPTPDTYEFPSQTVNTSGSSWGTGTSATGQTATWAHEYPIAPDVQTTIISSAQAEPIQIETDTNTTAAHTPIIKTLKGNLTDADVIALSHTATCAKRG